jgi:molybdopterin-guanine dinucleotide biosynthesis protein A
MKTKTFGLVLCGGKSTRMGVDKALMDYHGIPQYKWAAKLLAGFCDTIYFSVSKALANQIEGPIIIDKELDQGPLGGIQSAFEFNAEVNWLVMPCDMPELQSSEIELLVESKKACCFEIEGRVNPLLAYWPKELIESVQQAYGKGMRSPKRLVDQLGFEYLKPTNLAFHRNINRQK